MNSVIKYLSLSFVIFILPYSSVFSQLTVTTGQPAVVLVSALAGPGITILSPTLTCPAVANGTFIATGTLLSMAGGILLTNGHASSAAGPYGPPPGTASFNLGAPGDPSLTAILGGSATYDACVLQFDVVAQGDSIGFNYQFGSQEYYSAVCSRFNDLFAFFISGPGIAGTPNIALVPGTNIPVEINSVNDGIPGISGGVLSNCTSLGPGSPFTSYYLDNTGGTLLAYKGFTTKFRAVHAVNPCDTYHLKLAIADAGNSIYDSGVFLEGASLTTNRFSFNHADSIGVSISSIPHTIVKGCSPADITILSAHFLSASQTLHLTYGGTAIKGTDFSAPDSVSIHAGADSILFSIAGIPTPATGIKTIHLYLTTSSACGILDSVTLNVMDTPSAVILTPDTSVCTGTSFQIRVAGSAGLSYIWSPARGLSGSTVMQPVATPTVNVIYTMTATLPGSGCPAINRSIAIVTDSINFTVLTPDTSICKGQSVHIRVSGAGSLLYLWTPSAGLDSFNIKNPTATPDSTTIYTITAHTSTGCTTSKQVKISIITLNGIIYNPDTAICRGASVQVRDSGDSVAVYQWLPTAGIRFSTILNPLITPDTSANYFLTGSVPGCSMALDSVKIDVQPDPVVWIGGNRSVCKSDTIHIHAFVNPRWYTHYIYHWSPAIWLDDTTSSVVVFTPGDSTEVVMNVTTPAGCKAVDSASIMVHSIGRDSLGSVSICPHDSIQLHPLAGMSSYHWSPGMYLSDSLSSVPWLHAITSQTYRLIEFNQFGCRDTLSVHVTVKPAAVINAGDSVTLHPGESYKIISQSNCTSFIWFPASGLNDPYLSDPLAIPELSTRYYVFGTTSWGCAAEDSIDINVDIETLLDLPNAFAPGNGPNNILRINKRGNATLSYFRIFNRWGNKVYESSNIDAGWDGSYNGTPQSFDVYVYELEAITSTGRILRKHGNVTLIR